MMHSGPELLRLLKANGFEIVSVRGSHYKMRHPDGRETILPYCNSQYAKKTYHQILKDAGLRPSAVRGRGNIPSNNA